jgi:hypothetical protein
MSVTKIWMSWRLGMCAVLAGCVLGCFDTGDGVDARDLAQNDAAHRDADHSDADYSDAVVEDGSVELDSSEDAGSGEDAGFDAGVGDVEPDAGCADGLTDCDGRCVELESSIEHCGTCHRSCEPVGVHTVVECTSGSCAQQCEAGWTDLDGDVTPGCELDCETTNAGVEICDGADNDCNGQVDEDAAVDAAIWFVDGDGDGFGDAAAPTAACNQPQDHVANDADCDDTDASVHTTVDGYADQDADGFSAGGVQTVCTDGTLPAGYLSSQNGEDCDDADAATNPGADEVCGDQIDNDCDGSTDDASAVDASLWYVDCDGDTYSADTAGLRTSCEEPSTPPNGCTSSVAAWTDRRPSGANSTDCNDEIAHMYPGQTQWFDEPVTFYSVQTADWDYDCSGAIDYRWTTINASCSATVFDTCSGTSGWTNANVMFCGAQNSFQKCGETNYCDINGCVQSCDDNIVTRAQMCN